MVSRVLRMPTALAGTAQTGSAVSQASVVTERRIVIAQAAHGRVTLLVINTVVKVRRDVIGKHIAMAHTLGAVELLIHMIVRVKDVFGLIMAAEDQLMNVMK